ncbi:GFA family protein [Pelagovum pacificum]|uniref:GFA family protein n=1 Tax=Pelagovum pacificum TaxID=2588711 RepID=A0A5C5GLN6_9RHOB|nr:GFA family protein [Pelagovum pacificum]QQA42613.1 GFA family protein [Pelagovum pacificum]TNY34236.1 GFA family protein [Pelagovum pacificum]
MARTASCTCGQLSIVLEGELFGGGVCHCLACQSRTGSVFATLAGFGPPWTVRGEATVFERVGDRHGSRSLFHFCPVCGSTVFHLVAGYEDKFVSVAVGTFGDPEFPAPADSVYESRRHPWVVLPEGIARFETDPD